MTDLYERLGAEAFHAGKSVEDAALLSATTAPSWRNGFWNAQRNERNLTSAVNHREWLEAYQHLASLRPEQHAPQKAPLWWRQLLGLTS